MTTTMKIPSRELWSYFGYGVGQCFSFGLVGSFINYFYTDVLGISALAASTIFLIARAWDAVHDPLLLALWILLTVGSVNFVTFTDRSTVDHRCHAAFFL